MIERTKNCTMDAPEQAADRVVRGDTEAHRSTFTRQPTTSSRAECARTGDRHPDGDFVGAAQAVQEDRVRRQEACV